MADHNNKIVRVSVGKPTNLGKSQNVAIGWQKFLNKWFKTPTRTGESMRDYEKSAFNEKNRLKGAGGWMLMAPLEGKSRKAEFVQERQIVSLDFDNIPNELFDEIMVHKTHWLNDYEFLGHTTRSDREDSRRLRLLLLAEQDIPVENYEALTRIMAYEIDPEMEVVDPVSFRVAQMMYLPTVSKDQKYTVVRNQGKLLDMWEWLDGWKYDWKNKATLPRSEREDVKLRDKMEAEDPHEKRGIIGAFCRAYGIEDIISEFLPDVYGDQDPHSTLPRYTYLGGHSQYGAVVYDDKFLFSWHGTDPACEKLCNAWDLYRIHKFGKKDAEFGDDEIDIRELPSQKAMLEFAKRLPKVNAELAAEKIDLEAMLEDLGDDEDEAVAAQVEEDDPFENLDDDDRDILGLPPKDKRADGLPPYPGRSKAIPRNKNWTSKLEATLSGEIKCTVSNLVIILTHDPRFRGLMAINAFTGEMVATRTFKCQMAEIKPIPLRDAKNGDLWSKAHDAAIVALLSAPNGQGNYGYGMDVGDGKLEKALWIAAQQFVFHPVIDHLLALPEWDGEPRLDRMWIDYMGTSDTAYYRETARFTVVGVIARLFHPGLAFDYVPILISKQDRRKSTWVQHLGFGWWGGELTADFHNLQLAAEQMQGKLFLEMAEITNMKRSDAQQQKAFISRTKDKVRLAYDRRAIEFHRQNLFIGTTNEYEFLRDDQNRRFWPIFMNVEFIDTDRFLEHRDQIWAEALVRYKEMLAAAKGRPDRIFFRLGKTAKAQAEALQDAVRVQSGDDHEIATIEEFLERPVPLSNVLEPQGAGAEFESEDPEPTVIRVSCCTEQLILEALGEELPSNQHAKSSRTSVIGHRMSKIEGWVRYSTWKTQNDGGNAKLLTIPGYGRHPGYVRSDATRAEIALGYRVIEEPEEDLL